MGGAVAMGRAQGGGGVAGLVIVESLVGWRESIY
jgi:hypothetical protein